MKALAHRFPHSLSRTEPRLLWSRRDCRARLLGGDSAFAGAVAIIVGDQQKSMRISIGKRSAGEDAARRFTAPNMCRRIFVFIGWLPVFIPSENLGSALQRKLR